MANSSLDPKVARICAVCGFLAFLTVFLYDFFLHSKPFLLGTESAIVIALICALGVEWRTRRGRS